MWEVASMDQAVDWLKNCHCPMVEESDIEIRPLFEPDDFGEEFTPELREKEDIKEFYLGMKEQGARGERRWKKKKTWR